MDNPRAARFAIIVFFVVLAVIGTVIGIVAIAWNSAKTETPKAAPTAAPAPVVEEKPDTAENQGEDTAWYMAREFVERSLKAPATADFPIWGEEGTGSFYNTQTKRWVVRGYVDAQNEYGAKLRNRFIVRMEYLGDGKWKLFDVEMEP